MRRLAGAAAALVLFLAAGAVGAGSASAATLAGDRMVGPPAGFTPLTTAAAINGPITREQFAQLSGKKSLDDVPAKVVDEAIADSYARTWVNRETRDALVVLGFHLRNDDYAVSFATGSLEGATGDRAFTRVAGIGDIALFDVNDKGTKGRAAFLRRGRYVYEVFVVGQLPAADSGIAAALARQQLDLLPAGGTSLKPGSNLAHTVARLAGLALVVAVAVAVITFALRRTRTAPSGPSTLPLPPPPPPSVE
jgi:hypothetical protein